VLPIKSKKFRYSIFLDVTQRKSVATDVSGQSIVQLPTFRDNLSVSYRRFGTTYRSYLQGSNSQTLLHSFGKSHSAYCNYRRFGTTFRSLFQGTSSPISSDRLTLEDGTKTWVTNYESTLRNISEERRSRLPSGGCPLSRIPEIYCIFAENLQFIQWFFIHFLRFSWSQDSVTRTTNTQGRKKKGLSFDFRPMQEFLFKALRPTPVSIQSPIQWVSTALLGCTAAGGRRRMAPHLHPLSRLRITGPISLTDAVRNFSKCGSSFAF
jgi:hypothetical protein